MQECLELDETRFNGDLSRFRMVGMGLSSAMCGGKSIELKRLQVTLESRDVFFCNVQRQRQMRESLRCAFGSSRDDAVFCSAAVGG